LIFWVAAIFVLPVSLLRLPRRPFLPYFAHTAQQSVLDGTNGLSSSKPCAYCQIVRSELKPEVVLASMYGLPSLVYKRVNWRIHADPFFWLTYLS